MRFFPKILLIAVLVVGFTVPCSGALVVTSAFGWRDHPISGEESFHTGVDLGAEYGTPIGAVWAGTVAYAGWYGGYGNVVVLDHGDTVFTLYGHFAEVTVEPGQSVAAGDLIGYVGSTGYSTGPHLHLELWKKGQYVDPLTIWTEGE